MQKETIGKIEGLIFNTQKYSVHDGPGIRTLVFMKGCPLRCLWCSNPEGQNPWPEVAYYERLCTHCYRCVEICPNGAIKILEDNRLETLRDKCTNCGLCVKVCSTSARKIFGRYVTVDEILDIVKKDAIFYIRSEGGITVGGGEPLVQAEFVKELLRRAKEVYGIHTTIETSLYAKSDVMMNVLKYVDFIFCDIKHIDTVKHRQLTGVSNEQILDNIRLIVEKLLPENKELVIRVPIIPKINDDMENLTGIAEFIKSLDKNIKLELLSYHELGKQKYKALDRKYLLEDLEIKPPSKEYIEKVEGILKDKGINVIHT